jgi:hypothetical protein
MYGMIFLLCIARLDNSMSAAFRFSDPLLELFDTKINACVYVEPHPTEKLTFEIGIQLCV